MFIQRKWLKRILLWLALVMGLNACSSATPPIHITDVTISGAPVVGQIVDLHIEITSMYDEPEVTFYLDFLEEYDNRVNYISGDKHWVGPMAANEKKAFDVSVCVAEEGRWPIEIYARHTAPDGASYYDSETVFLESWIDGGKLIRNIHFSANEVRPTPRPYPISPECSGSK